MDKNITKMRPLYTLGLLILPFICFAQTPTIVSNHVIAGNCTAFAFGNGVYVASAFITSGATYTSHDAKNWTLLNSDPAPNFNYLAFGNGVFVGITGSSIYSSSDGINWTYRADAGGPANEINFTHGVFFVVTGLPGITQSTDGINWTVLNLGADIPSQGGFDGFDYNGSVYVLGVTVQEGRFTPAESGVLYSTTGTSGSWTFTAISAAPPVSNVTWAKDRFYLFAQDGIYTSADGRSWALPSPPLVDTMLRIGSVGTAGGSFILSVGDSIYLIGASSMEISTYGTHFKSYNPPDLVSAGGLSANGVTYIYGNGGLASATDGIHFTLNGTLFYALASNGSNYVAAGFDASGGTLFSSPDFIDWTEQLPPGVNSLSSISTVLYTGSKYAAAGSGNIYFSNDGISWSNNIVSPSFTSMEYGAGRYVAGSFAYNLLSSTDGLNWSEVDTSYSYYYKIRYLNNSFFALGMNFQNSTGRILQSADGIHWQNITPQTDSAVTYYNDVMYDGTKYYFVGLKDWTDFFTISTTDPTNTTSYGDMGVISNPAPGTSAVNYFSQFDDFIYRSGLFVGTVANTANGLAYVIYSSDGSNWTTSPLGGSGNSRTVVSNAGIYHIVSADGGFYTVSFTKAPPPPSLLRFEAEAVTSYGGGEDARLRWETKDEPDIAYFLVQHSLDTVRWDSIGEVNAEKRGDKEERNEKKWGVERYHFIHEAPPAGVNYYRIGITDGEGRRWWSPVRKVDIRGDIRVYPNPARDVLHVQLPEAEPARLIVFNHAWQPVRERVSSGYEVSIDLRSLPTGVYYLLVFQDGQRYSKEFIIVK